MKFFTKTQKLFLFILLLSLAFSVQAQPAGGETFAYHSETGMLRFVGSSAGAPISAPAARAATSPQQAAQAYLGIYGPQFGVANVATDLVAGTSRNLGNRTSFRYYQVYNGVPVFGAEIAVNVSAAGELLSMNGEVSPGLTLNTVPQVSAEAAQAAALSAIAARQQVAASSLVPSAATLQVYDGRLIGAPASGAALAWTLEVSNGAAIREFVIVDANTGAVLLHFNQIDDTLSSQGATWVANAQGVIRAPGDPGEVNLATYDSQNTTTIPNVFLCDETDGLGPTDCTNGAVPDGDRAHHFTANFYDYLYTTHGRNSLDDAGFELISNVRYDTGYCNAFWNGSFMTYGDGCPSTIVLDDVVGHELTHGFTEFTSNLIYFNQSGAINESLSDVWGELFDLVDGPETVPPSGDYRWRVGEELDFGSLAGPGIRDMRDPNLFGDPGALNDGYFYLASGDNYGVHINSGVNNKAVYLMVDGGSYMGVQVGAIGAVKAATIYYEAQTNHLTLASDYNDLYNILYQACNLLIGGAEGIGSSDCDNVRLATLATQMNEIPQLPFAEAELCPPGSEVGEVLFHEDWTFVLNNWGVLGDSVWEIGYAFPETGQWVAHGLDVDSTAAGLLFNEDPVTLPENAYLHFEHWLKYEGWGPGTGWDGGLITYSVNGGGDFPLLNSAFDGGLPPNEYIIEADEEGYSNAYGPSSSRYNLSDLAGQDFHVGFVSISDIFFGDEGWFIDEVSIHTCEQNIVENPGFENSLSSEDGGWTLRSADNNDRRKCNKPERGKIFSYSGECAFMFRGRFGVAKLLQKWTTDNPFVSGDTVIAGVMARSNNAGGRVKLIAIYEDNTRDKMNLAVGDTSNNWMEVADSLTLASSVKRLKFLIQYRGTSGKMFVDDAFVGYGENPLLVDAATVPLPEAPEGFRR